MKHLVIFFVSVFLTACLSDESIDQAFENTNENMLISKKTLEVTSKSNLNSTVQQNRENFTGYGCSIVHTPGSKTIWSIKLYNFNSNAADASSTVFSVNKNRKIQSVACDSYGKTLIYSMKDSVNGDFEIYQLDIAENQITQLTNNDTDDVDVSISIDSKRYAWQMRLADNRHAIQVSTMNEDSTFATNTIASAYSYVQPSLSSNGEWMVFVQIRPNNFVLIRYHFATNNYEIIKSIPRRKKLFDPSISDDGMKIGWTQSKSKKVYFVKDLSRDTTFIALSSTIEIFHPMLSNDGKFIIYSLNRRNNKQLAIKNIVTDQTYDIDNPLSGTHRYLGAYWLGNTKSSVLINEVGFGWVELINSSPVAVDLKDYQLKTRGYNQNIVSINLPTFQLMPNKAVVVKHELFDPNSPDGQSMQHISTYADYSDPNAPDIYPYGAGFVQISDNNGTPSDYVAWQEAGSFFSLQWRPDDTSQWTGTYISIDSNSYKSLTRENNIETQAISDTNSAADWSGSKFTTYSEPNDVIGCFDDNDKDGIPDCAEVPGKTFAGLPLHEWGARPNKMDLFIYAHYMSSNDGQSTLPNQESILKVTQAFAKEDIAVHFDFGDAFSPISNNNSELNLDGKNHSTQHIQQIMAGCEENYDINQDYRRLVKPKIPVNRINIFHYMLFADEVYGNYGGCAEINGNDSIIVQGLSQHTAPDIRDVTVYASIIMHELGHNLGLFHGGNEEINYKPNYPSVMNYMYTLTPSKPEHYGLEYYDLMGCYAYWDAYNTASQNIDFYNIDYSDGSAISLNETQLIESNGIGKPSNNPTPIDFNCDETFSTSPISLDINRDDQLSTLHDHDDWSAITSVFAAERVVSYRSTNGSTNNTTKEDILVNDFQESLP